MLTHSMPMPILAGRSDLPQLVGSHANLGIITNQMTRVIGGAEPVIDFGLAADGRATRRMVAAIGLVYGGAMTGAFLGGRHSALWAAGGAALGILGANLAWRYALRPLFDAWDLKPSPSPSPTPSPTPSPSPSPAPSPDGTEASV